MDPTAAPYDTMHLVLLNVVPHLWRLFAGLKLVNKKMDEDCIMPKVTVARIGREPRGARRTVPMAQEMSLRNIEVHHKSFKAIDCMHFILCSGEVLLDGRIPSDYFDIFMALSRACRLLFRPRGVLQTEIEAVDKDLEYYVSNYYAKIYSGTTERLLLRLPTIATLLDIVPLLWACGPAWVTWKFPMERKIGTLGMLIRTASNPHARLTANVTRHCKDDLVSSFGEQYVPKEWAATPVKQPETTGIPVGSLVIPEDVGPDCALLPPKKPSMHLSGRELESMRAALMLESETEVPLAIEARKYYRAKLAWGSVAGSTLVGSDSDKHRRRNYVVRINSTEEFFFSDRTVGKRLVSTFGAVLHYATVFIDGRPMSFAYVERVKSAKDRSGRYGYSAMNYGIETFLGLGGSTYYLPVAALSEVVATIEREGVQYVLHTREPFSVSE